MIKLQRTAKPVELTPILQQQLTDEYKATGRAVWNLPYIKTALLNLSKNKCCYCETNIKEESKYLEIEHFHHKDQHQDEVLEWTNLLPACKKCNGTKGSHDTIDEPIIDPTMVDPKNHLVFWRYRIKGIDELGKLTVSVLDLNNAERLVQKRFEIGNAIQEKLEDLNHLADDFIDGVQTSTRRRNRILNGTKDLMREGIPSASYSATSATIILTDTEFKRLKNKLVTLNWWDQECQNLELDLSNIALPLEQ